MVLLGIIWLLLIAATPSYGADPPYKEGLGGSYADSAYLSNVMGKYTETLRFADSCHKYVSPTDTVIILDISNETAVAALALHKWDLYHQSNNVYTTLFREQSADSTLPAYVRAMQRSKTNKTVAVVLLIMMLIIIFPAYYFLYYRHKLNYKFCVERIERMNVILLSDATDAEKLRGIEELADFSRFNLTSEQKARLREVVSRIMEALQENIRNREKMDTEAELAEDECHRLELDNDKLHISNSVLDNCLSTLKHETMYYPSRIRQMITREDVDLQAVSEVIDYYHDLYAILAEQALRQVLPQRIDHNTVEYMFGLLNSHSPDRGDAALGVASVRGDAAPGVASAQSTTPRAASPQYSEVRVAMPDLKLTDEQIKALFTPDTVDLKFLLVRQIVREMGEATNLRACGVSAFRDTNGTVTIKILMPTRYCKIKN